MKKTILLVITILVINYFGFGQIAGGMPNINGIPKNIPSPNAASLGEYGQIPVSNFTGLANINIPLFSGENVNVGLSYHGDGIRPENHSGWVGVGWNLNIGGAITRIVNGGVDEVLVSTLTPNSRYSHYDNPDILDRNLWFNNPNMAYYSLNTLSQLIPIPYPDEFTFNFNGFSGSFFYNHKGKWVVKSDQPIHFEVVDSLSSFDLLEEIQGRSGPDTVTIDLERIFYGFEITTSDGTKYTFGKTDNSIEFNAIEPGSYNYNENYIATTWYLTKIETPDNRITTFSYIRENKAVFKQSVTTNIFEASNLLQSSAGQNAKMESTQKYFLTYLDKIIFDKGEIDFSRSLSNELKYPFIDDKLDQWTIDDDYPYNFASTYKSANHWYKLDDIIIKNKNGRRIKKIDFNYIENSTSRLFLDEIKELGSSDNSFEKTHSFEYDSTSLPVYNSQKIDHWGYYNGASFFVTTPGEINGNIYTKQQAGAYHTSRNPNANFMQAGILKKITYPTGGFTSFTYEPHEYSSVVSKGLNSIFDLINTTSNEEAGGLRISEIISNATDPSSPPISKKYYYVNDFKTSGANSTSSGILNGYPDYFEEGPSYDGVQDYWFWNSYSIEPMSLTNGSHVTYSKVIEKSSDTNGFVEYTYSNHDNSIYRDSYPYASSTYSSEQEKFYPVNNKSLERGKILFEKFYKSDNTLIKEIKSFYVSQIEPSDNTIRALYVNNRQFGFGQNTWDGHLDMSGVVIGHQISAFEIYKYFNYLEKTEEITYDTDAINSTKVTTEYSYTPERLIESVELTDSNQEKIETTFSYMLDVLYYNLTPYKALIDEMISLNMINYPIEITKKVDGLVKEASLYEYGYHEGNIKLSNISKLKLSSDQSSFIEARFPYNANNPFETDPRYEEEVFIHKYDDVGNPIEVSKKNGSHTVYIWGYNRTEIIAKIENAYYNDVYNTTVNVESIQDLSNLDFDSNSEQNLRNTLDGLRDNSTLSESLITIYTYNLLVGVTSITDPSGYTTYYDYDHFNRLRYILNKDGDIIKRFKYHYEAEGSTVITLTYSITSTTDGNGTVNHLGVVNEGDDVTVTITPNTGYEITSITVNNIPQSISSSFTIGNVSTNMDIIVEFSLISNLTVNYTIDGGTYGSVSISPSIVTYGSSSIVTLSPNSGYGVEYVKVGSTYYSVSNNTTTITNITSDIDVHVKFKTLSLSITPTSMSFDDYDHQSQTVTVTASGSWTVTKSDSWITLSATSGSNSGTFTVETSRNRDEDTRYGTVVVYNGSTSKSISISQLGDP